MIEPLDRPTSDLPFDRKPAAGTSLHDVARITLGADSDDYDAYLAELVFESRTSPTTCHMAYLLQPAGDLGFNFVSCGGLNSAMQLGHVPIGPPPEAIVGTIRADVDAVRIFFNGDCGVATYSADGPTLPSNSSRRAFLQALDGCAWRRAEGLKNGVVVGTDFAPIYED